ncbi:MAG: hypothetical protein HYR49_00610 [Gammaproteobacteria bacterium]|nr:hypothetical protein [Gammaproteobacteria bacterium]
MIPIEVHFFNSLRRYGPPGGVLRTHVPPFTRVADLVEQLGLPNDAIYVAFQNGRNVMTTNGGRIETDAVLSGGDRLAFSGPVPFSRGYGVPVC